MAVLELDFDIDDKEGLIRNLKEEFDYAKQDEAQAQQLNDFDQATTARNRGQAAAFMYQILTKKA